MASNLKPSRRIYLLSHPRTASNLLVKILNLENQPALNHGSRSDEESRNKFGYFFLPTMPHRLDLAFRASHEWTEQARTQMKSCFQACADSLAEYVESAERQGRSVFVKEHLNWMIAPSAEDEVKRGGATAGPEADWNVEIPDVLVLTPEAERSALAQPLPRNETVLPDDFLLTWTPTFLIRHPALVFPSIYRTSLDLEGPEETKKAAEGMFRSEMTWRWTRRLCEWYWFHDEERNRTRIATSSESAEQRHTQATACPIILDADDIILSPSVVTRYCSLVGLDASLCRFEWPAASAEEQESMSFIERRMKSSLLSSTGLIVQGKTAKTAETPDLLETEKKAWKAEFGDEEAAKIERWVRDALPDYEFLRERRLKPL